MSTPRETLRLDCDVVLRDGGTARVRAITPGDRPRVATFFERLSPESVYFRVFGVGGANALKVEPPIAADSADGCALVGECGGDIVGLAQYTRDREVPSSAEAAFLVTDAMQGRGLGTRLLEKLAEHARANRIHTFHSWVLDANQKLLQMAVNSGFDVTSTSDQGVIHVTLALDETPALAMRTAERASAAAHASLGALFKPASVAIVGAGRQRGGLGAEILNNLHATGFSGRVVPVHPTARDIQGLPAYPRLIDVPGTIDLAVIVVPAAQVLAVARDAAAKHVKALVVISAGFSEMGFEGRAREAELLALARTAGMRMIGPNCMGLLNTDPSVRLNATFSPVFPPAGHVAFSTQSGALGLAVLDYARQVNVGISTFASIGNKADVSSNDLIQYWADDPETRVILLYLESFGNPRKFGQLARAVGQQKPIVAVKAGRSVVGARAASSHTGALASSDAIVDALFRHAGVIRTTTIEEMFDVAMLLDQQPVPAGNRVAILTNAGGPGILAADACAGHGLRVATLRDRTLADLTAMLPPAASVQNPVDMLATASASQYRDALRLLLADPGVDSVMTIFIPPVVTAAADVAAALTGAARSAGKPVVATFMGVDGAIPMLAPIPCYRFPEGAVSALAHAVAYGEWRRRPAGSKPDFGPDIARARAVVLAALGRGPGWLTPAEAEAVLAAAGVPVIASRTVANAEAAVAAAAELGYPVALKATGPSIVHKTDIGAVRLGLADEGTLGAAYQELAGRLGPRMTAGLVQRMAPSGVEMFIGGLQDAAFGPVVFAGSGGILVELFGDAACRLCPLTDRDVEEMLNDVRGIARLRGHRGAPPADETALRSALLRISALLDAVPEIHEMDVNPVTVLTSGVCALDARILVGEPLEGRPTRKVQY